jgi:hypothetical protein
MIECVNDLYVVVNVVTTAVLAVALYVVVRWK